jgi:hypothetical protein
MSHLNLATRCEALFASYVQSSEDPKPPQIRRAIKETLRRFGVQGCTAVVAQEFGDHPETAVGRMRWAREVVSQAYPCLGAGAGTGSGAGPYAGAGVSTGSGSRTLVGAGVGARAGSRGASYSTR